MSRLSRGRSKVPAEIDDADLHGCESSDLIQGTLDMLILKTLALEPMHGYGVVLRIEQISGGVFRVKCWPIAPRSKPDGTRRPREVRVASH